MTVERVLRTFAELSKNQGDFRPNVLRSEHDFVWLKSSAEALFREEAVSAVAWTTSRSDGFLEKGHEEPKVDRLIGAGQLHRTEQMLRAGWVWIAGKAMTDDGPVTYCFPLVSVPLSRSNSVLAKARQISELLKTGIGSVERVLEAVGDTELSPIIPDEDRLALMGEIAGEDIGALKSWRERAAEATGLVIDQWATPDDGNPSERSTREGFFAFVGVGLYLEQLPEAQTQRQALLELALTEDLEESSLAAIYTAQEPADEAPQRPVSVRPLTSRQTTVTSNAGAAQLTVISGAPGTGKTHVLSSIAIDAVAKQQSVLVVGSTRYATDVLLDHFAEIGSIQPVAFGSSRHRKTFAEKLIASNDSTSDTLEGVEEELIDVSQQLAIEREAFLHRSNPTYAAERIAELDRAGDLEELGHIIERYFLPKPADLLRNNGKVIETRLDLDLSDLDKTSGGTNGVRSHLQGRLRDCLAIRTASQRSVHESDGATLNLDRLTQLTEQASRLEAEWIQHTHLSNLTPADESVRIDIRRIMLENNRSARAQSLREVEPSQLKAAPLWVGSLDDVNELLPRTSSFFDVVIMDEAAQVSQPAAAGVLMRAKSAVLCGDPQQLRHQSNLSSDQVRAATDMFATNPDVLDFAAHSVLDVVAAKVPTQLLDEHFRSVPHLIEFSNRRFYGGGIKTTTRHPSNEAADHIHVVVAPSGQRASGDGGANADEAAECLKLAGMYIAKGWRSIGFVSPFEAQAKLLEEMILAVFTLDEIEEYGLRVGSVRAFQGDERDVMILSWAIGADENDSEWDVVNDDALFNVMVTRARHQVVVVTSNPTPPGLAGEYVKWAEPLEDLEVDQPPSHPWVETVVAALGDAAIPTRTGYRVGQHLIDVVAGSGASAVAIDCVTHREGVDAHIERALTLRGSGWRTSEAFEGSWGYRPNELAQDLTDRFPDLVD